MNRLMPLAPPPAESRESIVRALEIRLNYARRTLKPDEDILLLCASSFGVMEVLQVAIDHSDLLHIWTRDAAEHFIIASAAQCSFMLTIITSDPDAERKRVIFGFSTPPNDGI